MTTSEAPSPDGIQRLKALYAQVSKHSHYQIMPDFLADLVDPVALNKRFSRYEVERMDYFQKHVPFKGARVVDIGANTGYFSFAAADAGGREVVAYEGNREHADFLRTAAELFHKPVRVVDDYMDFSGPLPGAPYDIILLLNVLHHVGDDFGDRSLTIEQARREIITNLNHLADKTKYLILQIGFSWKTNYDYPLFAHGTKEEMIQLFKEGVEDHWSISAIGIAREEEGRTIYRELDAGNIVREDHLGEFRNRPVFILKSLRC